MATKHGSRTLLQRLAEKGFPVDFEVLSAPFNIEVTSIVSYGVDDGVIGKFSQSLKELVRESKFQCELADIVVFLIIVVPGTKTVKDTAKWKRASRAYMVYRNIDIDAWQCANANERKKFVVDCVVDALASIPEKHLTHSNQALLEAMVREAARPKRKLPGK